MAINIFEWFSRNWNIIFPLGLSIIAIIFTALKDFILPSFLKPKLEITYERKEPYKRQTHIKNNLDQMEVAFFYRFKIKNLGRITAKNCRSQIYSIKDKGCNELDLQGFPLRWANRPDSKERLNISLGESEFVDLASTRINSAGYFYFEPYHNISIGMNSEVILKDYTLKIIISGDNFKPYFIIFKINGSPKEKHILEITLKEVVRK